MLVTSFWVLTAFWAGWSTGIHAACECGYRDPKTSDLWTDAVITYFNESTAARDIAFAPAEHADRYGRDDPGRLSDAGQEAWINSNRVNEWEDDFGATWRSAVVPNNVHLGQKNGSGLLMDVTPADTKNRISPGSQLQTRRRDMLFGSFRTMLNPPSGLDGQGTTLDVMVAWNQSMMIRTAFFDTDTPGQGYVQVSYASSSQSVIPFTYNQSTMNHGVNEINGVEYRMDWSPQAVVFSNSGTNKTSNLKAWTGEDAAPPVIQAPFSFKHWSNGSPTQSMGPPTDGTVTAQIMYARLFFNSSVPEREESFNAACKTAQADPRSTCSTEDLTLRNSTHFDISSTLKPVFLPKKHHTPMYSIYGMSISGGIFVLLTAHAAIVRARNSRRKLKRFYEKYNAEVYQRDQQPVSGDAAPSTPVLVASEDPQVGRDSDASSATFLQADYVNKHAFDDAMHQWDDPISLLNEEVEDGVQDGSSIGSDSEDGKGFESWELSGNDIGSEYSNWTRNSGYVLPHLQVSRRDLNQPSDVFSSTPMDTRSPPPTEGFPIHDYSVEAQGLLPVQMSQAPSQSFYGSPLPSATTNSYGMAYDSTSYPASPIYQHNRAPPTVILEDGSQAPIAWITPIADWTPIKDDSRAPGQMGARLTNPNKSKFMPSRPPPSDGKMDKLTGIKSKLFESSGAGRTNSSGLGRVEYLDGLRAFACLLVSLHHFFLIFYYGFTTQPTGSGEHYAFEKYMYSITGPILCNGGLNVGIFFVLAARVVCNRYLLRGNLEHLAQFIQTRVPRLSVPITAAIVINYCLMEVNAFYWVPRLASRTYSTWSYYDDYENAGVFLDEFLGLWWLQPPAITPLITHYATGILWTVPTIVQCSWTCALCALVAREIKHPMRRYLFYVFCIAWSWYANTFDYFFLSGLMLADLDIRLQYREKLGWAGNFIGWPLFLAGAGLAWTDSFKLINTDNEWRVHPDYNIGGPNAWAGTSQPYYLPKASDAIWVLSFFVLCDLNKPMRNFFQLKFWVVFGRNAFSLYLLHGIVFWGVGAPVTLQLLAAGVPYWASQIVNIVVCYILLFILCEAFTRTFDRFGITLARAFWRGVTGGLGRKI